jgi:hypothetical protein
MDRPLAVIVLLFFVERLDKIKTAETKRGGEQARRSPNVKR